MEVAGGDDLILVGEDGRVVGRAVDLCHEHALHVRDGILRRTVYLRHAAERIWVLNLLAGTVDKLTALKIIEDYTCRLHLSFVGTYCVYAGSERLLTAVESLE